MNKIMFTSNGLSLGDTSTVRKLWLLRLCFGQNHHVNIANALAVKDFHQMVPDGLTLVLVLVMDPGLS